MARLGWRSSRSSNAASGSAQSVFLDLAVERAEPDPEDRGGARLVETGLAERRVDELPLRLFDGHADGQRESLALVLGIADGCRQIGQIERALAIGEHHHALENTPQ